jgi:Trypsin
MKFLILAALLATAFGKCDPVDSQLSPNSLFLILAAPKQLVLPRLPLSVLMKGNLPLIDPIPKIVGGTPIAEFEFPFLISLQRQGLLTWSHSCGGSIISEKYVLDAAHCIDG